MGSASRLQRQWQWSPSASREREREAAFAALDSHMLAESPELHTYVLGLSQTLNVKGELNMAETLTPEIVMAYGKRIRELIIEAGTPEERVAVFFFKRRRPNINRNRGV